MLRNLTCQQVKSEHENPRDISKRIPIHMLKTERNSIDFEVDKSTNVGGCDFMWVVLKSN